MKSLLVIEVRILEDEGETRDKNFNNWCDTINGID
jgi:hypothetical protein